MMVNQLEVIKRRDGDETVMLMMLMMMRVMMLMLVYCRQTLAWTVAASFVVEDFYFYWIHRLLHYGWFYKNIHKIHHDFTGMPWTEL